MLRSPQARRSKFSKLTFIALAIFVLAGAGIMVLLSPAAADDKQTEIVVHVGPGEDMYADLEEAYDDVKDGTWDQLTFLIEPGIYPTSLRFEKSVAVVGSDPRTTILVPDSNVPVFRFRSAEFSVSGIGFRNTVDNWSQGTLDAQAVDGEDLKYLAISDCTFEGFNTCIDIRNTLQAELTNLSFAFSQEALVGETCENVTLVDCRFSFIETAVDLSESQYFFMDRCRFTDVTGDGIILEDCYMCGIGSSFLTGEGTGLSVIGCDNLQVIHNYLTGWTTGANVTDDSTNITVMNNEFSWCSEYGLFLDDCIGNVILWNNFLNNTEHAYDSGNNTWNYTRRWWGGNYWGGIELIDEGLGDARKGDDISDLPFNITGGDNVDSYPLMYPVRVDYFEKEEDGPGLIDFVFSLPALLAAVVSIILGVYVLGKNSKAASNRVFFLIMLGCFIWGGGEFMHRLAINGTWIFVWYLFSNTGLLLIIPSLFHFTFVYPTNVLEGKPLRHAILTVYIPAFIIGVGFLLLFKTDMATFIILGIILYFFIFVIAALVRIMLIYLGAKDALIKMQAIYLTLGLIIILLIISMELVLGAMQIAVGFVLIADSLIIFFITLFFAIAVLRYRLVDVEIIFKKTMFFSTMSIFLGGIFLVFTETMEAFFALLVTFVPSLTGVPEQVISLIAAFMVVLAIAPARIVIKKILDRVFPQSRKFEKEYLERLEAYEQTLRGMWADGSISAREREALIILMKKLDLTQQDHDEIEKKLMKELHIRKPSLPPPPGDK